MLLSYLANHNVILITPFVPTALEPICTRVILRAGHRAILMHSPPPPTLHGGGKKTYARHNP